MTTDIQLAGTVAKFVELTSVTLSAASVRSSIDPNKIPETLSVANRYRASFEKMEVENARSIRVSVDFGFDAFSDPDEVADKLVDLTATFLLIYTLSSDAQFEEEAVTHFASINGAYNAWPYWRELVQSVAGRVGLSGIVLPVFRPTAKPVEPRAQTIAADA